jgi:hypothetical protein
VKRKQENYIIFKKAEFRIRKNISEEQDHCIIIIGSFLQEDIDV